MDLFDDIVIDLALPGVPPRIYAKQDDSKSRGVAIRLFYKGTPLMNYQELSFMVRYKTAQGRIGLYDTMPDGATAIAPVPGSNIVQVSLVDQIFAMPGDVECELRIMDADGAVSTWTWIVSVQKSNVGDATIPSDYINVFSNIAQQVKADADRAEAAAEAAAPGGTLVEVDVSGISVENATAEELRYVQVGRLVYISMFLRSCLAGNQVAVRVPVNLISAPMFRYWYGIQKIPVAFAITSGNPFAAGAASIWHLPDIGSVDFSFDVPTLSDQNYIDAWISGVYIAAE